MINPTDAEIGQTVYLRPMTKQAPRECYLQLAAVLVSITMWPIVKVRIFDRVHQPEGRVIDVHRDNVGLRRRTAPKADRGGDTTQDEKANGGMVGRPIGKPVPQVDPSSGYEQDVLF